MLLTGVAWALDGHTFSVAADPEGFLRLPTVGEAHTGDWDAGLVVDYADDPVAEELPWGREPIVDALATANVLGAYAFRGVRFEFQVPVHAVAVGYGDTWSALGDVQFGAGLPVVDVARVHVGVHTGVTLPTGAQDRWLGTEGPRAVLAATATGEVAALAWTAMAGAVAAIPEEERGLRSFVGPALGAGIRWHATDAVDALVEVVAEGEYGFASVPVEASAAGRMRLPKGIWALAGAGAGIGDGVGAPRWRAFVGLGFAFRGDPAETLVLDPSSDRDGDGFFDLDDRCPDQAETVDGYTDDDGCPELDGDGDGVAFDEDACPGEPIRPEQDPRYSDGCPKVAEFAGDRIVITETVFFREGRAELIPSSEHVLEAVRAVMSAHPEIAYFLVEGHANSNGTDAYNLRLSDARAYSVMRWLGDHGVERTRLLSKGFGEARPLADGHPDALAIDRRVEFRVVRVEDIPPDARTISLPGDVGR